MKTADFDIACERAARYANRHNGGLQLAEQFLARAGWGAETFGIEYVSCADKELAYLNTGETYSLTLGQENGGDVFSTSWGGWYENAEQEHCEEEGVISCAYCGEFTPMEEGGEWSDTVCEHCGHYVDGSGKPVKEAI